MEFSFLSGTCTKARRWPSGKTLDCGAERQWFESSEEQILTSFFSGSRPRPIGDGRKFVGPASCMTKPVLKKGR